MKDQTLTGSLPKLCTGYARTGKSRYYYFTKLSEYSEKEVMQFHGMGKGSLPKLRQALAANGLAFKAD